MEGREDFGAFIHKFQMLPPPSSDSTSQLPLHGLTFAVKDLFDIVGYVTGLGNPDWANTHETATSMAPVVLSILNAGGTCLGKTVMDEMAYSINGENKHYGTPVNPAVPDRVPGGSSSGSAVAVAAKIVDFSLGTDTGGSVRVPAAYCGIFGFRPSHAVVSTSGVIPMAPSFDTVGWFTRDPETLIKVGCVLLQLPSLDMTHPRKVIIPSDCFQYLSFQGELLCEVLTAAVKKTFRDSIVQQENLGSYIENKVPSLKMFTSENSKNQRHGISSLSALSNALRLLQRFEFKSQHGNWVKTVKPDLGPGISERVWEAVNTAEENVDSCRSVKHELQVALVDLLKENGVLAVPTVPGPPPKLLTEVTALENFRAKAFSLLSISGMSGFCQVAVPLGMCDNLPVSVSFIAKHGADGFLLNLVQSLHGPLTNQFNSRQACSDE